MKILLYFLMVTFLTFSNIYAFDDKKAAYEEVESWKAYYAKNLEQAAHHLKGWIEEVYDIPNAEKVLPLLLKTMTEFGPLPMQTEEPVYQEKILPLLQTTFQEVKNLSSKTFDVKLVAGKELEWWVARRLPGQVSAENIGTLMSQMYAFLYGGRAEEYSKAAYLRAEAARYRDLCQDRFGNKVTEEDWQVIHHRLEISYQELNKVLSSFNE